MEKGGDSSEELLLKIDKLVDQVKLNSSKEGTILRLKEHEK